jgi:hypothetical protein
VGAEQKDNTFFSTRSGCLYNVVKLKSLKTFLRGTSATPEDGTYSMQALKQLLRLVGKSEVLTPSVKVRVNLKYASHGSGKHII